MRRLGVAVAVLMLTTLVACSSGGGTKTAPSSSTTTASTAPEPTVAAGSPKPATGGDTTVTTAATSTTRGPDLALTSFRSPSDNIGCEMASGLARCDIKERSWSPPAKPANCDLDWGQGIQISGTDQATFVCAGDTALDPSATVLAYGQRARQGSVVCASESAGVTCANEATKRGFFLSRDSYRIF